MNLKKLFVTSMLLTLSSSLLAATDPWDRREDRREDRRDRRDEREDRRDQRGQIRTEEVFIRDYFFGQSRLDLVRDAYTRARLQGARILDVMVFASTERGQGQARVLVNGQETLEGEQQVAREILPYTFRIDPFANVLGQSLRTLDLEMKGRFYVEKVVFNVLEAHFPPGPGPGHPGQPKVEVVRQQLQETIQGEGGLHLFRMFNLGAERQGQAIKKVTILARSARGNGQAQLHVNDQSSGVAQTIGISPTRLAWDLGGLKIGQQIQGLRLQIRGNVVVEEVSIEIETRPATGPGPGPGFPAERRIDQVINQRLYDTSGVALTDLMMLDRRHEGRVVDSVELVLRNADMATRVKLCEVVEGQFQSVNCGAPITLSNGAQVVRLTSLNFAQVRDLHLSVRMGMIDIERITLHLR